MTSRLHRARAFVAGRLRSAWLHRIMLFAAAPMVLLLLLLSAGFIHHVYFDRSRLPDIEPFISFEPPATGKVYDARGNVLIELAREYRRVVSYDEVPVILRQAILAAEDKNFFSRLPDIPRYQVNRHPGQSKWSCLVRAGTFALCGSARKLRELSLRENLSFANGL